MVLRRLEQRATTSATDAEAQATGQLELGEEACSETAYPPPKTTPTFTHLSLPETPSPLSLPNLSGSHHHRGQPC